MSLWGCGEVVQLLGKLYRDQGRTRACRANYGYNYGSQNYGYRDEGAMGYIHVGDDGSYDETL